MDDDARNECFRKYADADESYFDHSEFLTTRGRYSFLFELDPLNYKAWAKGLKKAGYATNPQYANRLITLIEEFELNKYDEIALGLAEPLDENLENVAQPAANSKEEFVFNGIRTVWYGSNDNTFAIAEREGIPLKKLLKFNDMRPDQDAEVGTRFYLQPKKKHGRSKVHKVQPGESLYDIAQTEGIQLKQLRKKNLLNEGEEPLVGETVYLRSKRQRPPKLKKSKEFAEMRILREKRFRTASRVKPSIKKEPDVVPKVQHTPVIEKEAMTATISGKTQMELLEEKETQIEQQEPNVEKPVENEEPVESEVIEDEAAEAREEKFNTPEPVEHVLTKVEEPKKVIKFQGDEMQKHLVKQGETLWAISRKYGVSVDELRSLNGMASNEVNIGDYLIIRKMAPEGSAEAEGEFSFSDPIEDELGNVWHVVVQGQTLYYTSVKYKTTVSNIRELNNMTASDAISPGQKIMVKKSVEKAVESTTESSPAMHTVAKGETLYAISRHYGVSVGDLKKWNNLPDNNLSVGSSIRVGE